MIGSSSTALVSTALVSLRGGINDAGQLLLLIFHRSARGLCRLLSNFRACNRLTPCNRKNENKNKIIFVIMPPTLACPTLVCPTLASSEFLCFFILVITILATKNFKKRENV